MSTTSTDLQPLYSYIQILVNICPSLILMDRLSHPFFLDQPSYVTTQGYMLLLFSDLHSMNVERLSSSRPVCVKRSAHPLSEAKRDVTFMCPFRGCESTFTKSLNLKGHIRSHNEEKLFVSPWPGCGKDFARQHDCKRHEQLHPKYRPFSCEPCGKVFARMNALNRHLRSEGGAQCARVLEGQGPGG
ncbi:hypothetical protein EDD18DRAFT_818881 [Armillaria luteobubalina]|uniref:C2H2-type domain-containing protein n=1 Tax=Armillaria luteobubalina TaxID=153913 RepID=A0AA39TTG9_9AGAR|nr:hypothetical protein EDD18DRAFT_818881 [Armillaria luteobubalina]